MIGGPQLAILYMASVDASYLHDGTVRELSKPHAVID
jgi:hypothetical protein